ncbi:SdrD B-like domain-containing protein [Novipirellula herctigrandis]
MPNLSANNTGTVQYDSTSNTFTATATPLLFVDQFSFPFGTAIQSPKSYDLQFQVDENGSLISGVPGPDFILTGEIDIDSDETIDVSGTLLTGEVIGFGFQDSGSASSIDAFDLRLSVTGGELTGAGQFLSGGSERPAYFLGKDIGMKISSDVLISDSISAKPFTGSFTVDFNGGNKSLFGPTEPLAVPAELGNYIWYDLDRDGTQDDNELGVNGVRVQLYEDADGDGIAEPNGDDGPAISEQFTTDLNGEAGYYLFEDLAPGDYFVVFDPNTIPSGFEFTTQDVGTDDAIDSDADTTTGATVVTTLEANESDLTWDAGISPQINPAIEIIKYVDKIIESSEMTTIDFDGFAQGTIVESQYPGVTISAVNARRPNDGNQAMVFNSSAPTGGDKDLGTPNENFGGLGIGSGGISSNDTDLGNVLIISEDGVATNPDDEAMGGTFTFTFDQPVTVNYLDLLDIDSDEQGGSVVTLTTASGTQTFNIPALGNNSVQQIAIDVDNVVEMNVNFVSSGAITELKYTKTSAQTQWYDANEVPGVSFEFGEQIEFSYHVTNPGDVSLKPVVVTDDNATPNNDTDNFAPTPVETDGFNVGDIDQDAALDPGEEWIYTATTVALTVGQFTNIGDVVGTPINNNGDVIGDDVTDDDPANYVVEGIPNIDIEKLTNSVQADDPSDAVEIASGEEVTWTYIVTNTGSTTFSIDEVIVLDDSGTPDDTSDDFSPSLVAGPNSNDEELSPGESWTYTASGTAQTLTTTGATSVFDFNGSSNLDGPDGNIRSLTTDGVSVNASAFSRDSVGNWEDAFLGIYSGALGVTDSGEGDGGGGKHRVDNLVRDNYVLFEFSENIVVDKAYLESVVGDSDLSIWIGTIPGAFGSHQTLSDAVLNGLTLNEQNDTTSSQSRWADFNAGKVSGNVLVLAASTVDTTPEDQFKIHKIKFQHLTTGIYGNIATVDADGAWDSDPSHYVNPAPQPPGIPGIDIEKLTNGIDADTSEAAVEIAPGSPVTWTYVVTNTGETAFAFQDVVVTDDNGTPNNPVDDFAPEFVGPDDGDDGLLSPGEVWHYTYNEATAQTLTTSGVTSVFQFVGNSGLDGPNGNVRSFTVDDVSVNASAFSSDSNGTWSEAFLGIYSGGLGVTDSGEGDGGGGKHRVDNIDRTNYVLFEFSESIVVDKAYLDSVVTDSDLSVWVGTIDGAYDSHQTLSDDLLSSLSLNEVNDTTSSQSRWADINSGEVSGNVLVLAASTVDPTPEDQFKIHSVKFQHLTASVYANVGTVVAGSVSDADASHYKNPEALPSSMIGDFVWNDVDRDGQQDHDEVGIAGVTVELMDVDGELLDTTQTNSNGLYNFSGLAAGDYTLKFIPPTNFVFSARYQGSDAENGSNADPVTGLTEVIHLNAGQVDKSIDAGMYQAAVDTMFEAEDYEWIDSPWQVRSDASASGGKAIEAPNMSGSYYYSPPNCKKVQYSFSVAESGMFELSGLVQARSSKDNSVWVKVNDKPWVEWHIPVTGNDYQWQAVTDGWHQNAVTFDLDAGVHTMQLRVREDGTRLDKFQVSKLATTTIVIDAADFDSKRGDWKIELDDDGNEFLVAANGTGTHYNSPSYADELTYDFTLDQGGLFAIHALVSAANNRDNSFWVAIDDGHWVEWHLTVTGDQWQWQTVSDGAGHDQVGFELDAGDHTLRIKVREDGTKLDKIVISNDDSIVLDDF